MKTFYFYIITWLLMLALNLQVVYAQQQPTTESTEESAEVIFQLAKRLQFADGTEVKSIAKDNIDALRDRPIRLGLNKHLDGVMLTNQKNRKFRVRVRTCREYDAALKRGYYPNSNFDYQMSIWFRQHCGLLNALKGAAVPQQSFISNPKVGITNLDLIPLSLFPEAKEIDSDSGATFQKQIKNGKLVVLEKNQNYLAIKGIDMAQGLQEVVRADFNNDGIEDILLFESHNIMKGTYGDGGVIVLTRKSVDGSLKLYDHLTVKNLPHYTGLIESLYYNSSCYIVA